MIHPLVFRVTDQMFLEGIIVFEEFCKVRLSIFIYYLILFKRNLTPTLVSWENVFHFKKYKN